MSINDLPNELLLSVANAVELQRDLNAFARSSRDFYVFLNPLLYQRNVERHGSSALLWAAEYGKDTTCQLILGEGGDINASTKGRRRGGVTALHLACANGHLSIATHLIMKGARVDLRTRALLTPLQLAVRFGHEPLARLLIENGADIHVPWPSKARHLLHVASFLGHAPIVELLLNKGEDIDYQDLRTRQTPLLCAVGCGGVDGRPLSYTRGEQARAKRSKYGRAWELYRESDAKTADNIFKTARLLLALEAKPLAVNYKGETARDMGKRHADPRIQKLFSRRGITTLSQAKLNRSYNPETLEQLRIIQERRKQSLPREETDREKIAAAVATAKERVRQERARLQALARVGEAERRAEAQWRRGQRRI